VPERDLFANFDRMRREMDEIFGGVLERSGQPISFVRFLLIGLPVTGVSLLIASAYLILFQL